MWADSVVVLPPSLDQYLCVAQRVEDLAIEQLIAQLPVECLTVPALPRTAGFDVQNFSADSGKPCSQRFGDYLGAIVE